MCTVALYFQAWRSSDNIKCQGCHEVLVEVKCEHLLKSVYQFNILRKLSMPYVGGQMWVWTGLLI